MKDNRKSRLIKIAISMAITVLVVISFAICIGETSSATEVIREYEIAGQVIYADVGEAVRFVYHPAEGEDIDNIEWDYCPLYRVSSDVYIDNDYELKEYCSFDSNGLISSQKSMMVRVQVAHRYYYGCDDFVYAYVCFRTPETVFSYDIVDGGAVITQVASEYDEQMMIVPETLGNYPVTGIGNRAFFENKCKFVYCPDSLLFIDDEAFYCSKANFIRVSDKLEKIGNAAFAGSNLFAVNLPNTITVIPDYAFCYTAFNISSASEFFSPNLESIGAYAFANTQILFNIDGKLPDTLLQLGEGAFDQCSRLLQIEIPDSITTIKQNTFRCCYSLNYVSLPETLTQIDTAAFEMCTSLESNSINLSNIISIGNEAFRYCESLETVDISAVTQCIGKDAFRDCINVVYYNVDEGNIFYASHEGVLYDKEFTRLIMYPAATVRSKYVFPQSVRIIEEGALNYISGTDTIIVNSGFEGFYKEMFMNSNGLKRFEYNGMSLQNIPEGFFKNCSQLEYPVEWDGVENVGKYAFMGCSSLKEIYFDNALVSIDEEAFSYCGSLNTITLCSQKVQFGSSVFRNSGLKTFVFPEMCERVEKYMFYGCEQLQSVMLPENISYIGVNAFAETGITDIELPVNLLTISSYAFYNTMMLTEITIPSGLEVIGSSAFEGSHISSIVIPNTVKKVGTAAFRNCTELTFVVFGNSLNSIQDSTFCGCISLNSIMFSESILDIGRKAFSGCTSLAEVSVGSHIRTIRDMAFADCSNLCSVHIFPEVEELGKDIFDNCSNHLKIAGWKNSSAYEWALENNVDFMILDTGLVYDLFDNEYIITGCDKYTISITLPNEYNGKQVNGIAPGAFSECIYLKEIDVEDGSVFTVYDSVVYSADRTVLVVYPPHRSGELFVIDSNVIEIASCAFDGAANLKCIYVTENIISIGENAFGHTAQDLIISGPEGCYASVYSIENGLIWESKDESYEYISSAYGPEDYIIITRYLGSSKQLVIPSTINGYHVHGVSGLGLSDIEKVVVSEGIERIENTAFWECEDLRSITLPDSVVSIGEAAFSRCQMLEEIKLGNGLKEISRNAFQYCENLKRIDLPNSLEIIGEGAFRNSGLTEIHLPANLVQLGEAVFENCYFLDIINTNGNTNGFYVLDGMLLQGGTLIYASNMLSGVVEIPEGTVRIGNLAFGTWDYNHKREAIDYIVLPSTVQSIGEGAFMCCTNMIGIDIPDGLVDIGDYAFAWCETLESISIPAGVKHINQYTFMNCDGLSEINGCEGLISIEDNAFNGDSAVNSMTLPGTISYIGSLPTNLRMLYLSEGNGRYSENNGVIYDAEDQRVIFVNENIDGSIIIADGVKGLAEHAFKNREGLTSIYIPDSVVSIGAHCFEGCISLASVRLPAGLASIEAYTFYGCAALEQIDIPTSVKNILNWAFAQSGITQLEFGEDGPTYIGPFSFDDCDKLLNLSIANADTSIREYAFADCHNLALVTLPEEIAYMEGGTFSNCTSLKEVVLPRNASTTSHFSGCTALEKVVLPEDITGIDGGSFSGCISLKEVNLPDLIQYVGAEAFKDCVSLSNLIFPESLEFFGASAFAGTGIVEAVIAEGITEIPDYLFAECHRLERVVLPTTIKKIGDCAFMGCGALNKIELPKDLEIIGGGAFSQCKILRDIDLPEQLREIGPNAFEGCSGITSVTIPSGVSEIGEFAFNYCENVRSVYIGEGTAKIGGYAFCGCPVEIVNIGSVKEVGDYAFFSDQQLTRVISSNPSIESIGERAFYCCDKLVSIDVSSNLKYVGFEAFARCTVLERVSPSVDYLGLYLPKIEEIGESAFMRCISAPAIVLGTNLMKVGRAAFYDDILLRELNFPDSVTEIGDYVASGCCRLEKLHIPTGLHRVPMGFAADLNNLIGIHIPNSITVIGERAFNTNSAVGIVELPNSVIEIENEAFARTVISVFIPSSVTIIAENAFYLSDAVIYTPIGSYAEQYAIEKGIPVINVDSMNGISNTSCDTLVNRIIHDVIVEGMDEYEKSEAIIDWMIENINYTESSLHQTAKSVLLQKRGNYWGWSETYAALLDGVGIEYEGILVGNSGIPEIDPSYASTTVMTDSEDRIDIIEKIDGDWYFVDVGHTKTRGKFECFMLNGEWYKYARFGIVPDDIPDSSAYRNTYIFREYAKPLAETLATEAQSEFNQGKKLFWLDVIDEPEYIIDFVGRYMDSLEWNINGEQFEPGIIGTYNGFWFAGDMTDIYADVNTDDQFAVYGGMLSEWGYSANLCGYSMGGEIVYKDVNAPTVGEIVTESFVIDAEFVPELCAYIPTLQPTPLQLKVICVLPAPDSYMAFDGHMFEFGSTSELLPDDCELAIMFEKLYASSDAKDSYILSINSNIVKQGGEYEFDPKDYSLNGNYTISVRYESINTEPSIMVFIGYYNASEHITCNVDVIPATSNEDGCIGKIYCCCGRVLYDGCTIDNDAILTLPNMLKRVGDNAFTGTNAKQVTINNGVIEIGSKAFANCKEMMLVVIPDSVEHIADDAFMASNVVIYCKENSYAYQYAQDKGLYIGGY